MTKPPLTLLLANPRGFCAGVERAIEIVERALEKFGTPVYVRHEIVHNQFVVASLKAKGAVFVDDLSQVPDDAMVIFSAHGVPKTVPAEASRRRLSYLDATCPLVSKVHREVERHHRRGKQVLLIGHGGHPEVVGTMGQLPGEAIQLVETVEQVASLRVRDPLNLAYVTQTTLSLDDTAEIVGALRARFPQIEAPRREDICYATTNRQNAVKRIAAVCDALFVVGAPNSSNSQRLVEVARRAGCPLAVLLQRACDIPWERLRQVRTLGLSAGASAPDCLVDEVLEALHARYEVELVSQGSGRENVHFKLPRRLAEPRAA